jgi:hypothetical protein
MRSCFSKGGRAKSRDKKDDLFLRKMDFRNFSVATNLRVLWEKPGWIIGTNEEYRQKRNRETKISRKTDRDDRDKETER